MTGHRGSAGLQGTVDWTDFGKPQDIPDRIPKASTDTYQGPHDDEPAADGQFAESGPAVAPAVTPALLGAHYRLGSHRAAGESRVAVYPADDPSGVGPALQVATDNGAMLMEWI